MEIITINFVNDLVGARNLIKMPLLVQCSVVESFNFNEGKVQSVHVNGEECLVSREVYMAIGYEEENSKKAIQNLVPKKYKLRFGEVKPSLSRRDDIFLLHKEKVLLKEPGLYCFLSRCKRDEAEPFMEWVVETVLPREARKLASAIDEKDNQIQALEFRNEEHQHKILGLNEETNDLIAHRHVARRGCFDNVQCFIKKNSGEVHPYYVIQCQYRQLEKHKRLLKLRYPNMEVAEECDNQNANHQHAKHSIPKPTYQYRNTAWFKGSCDYTRYRKNYVLS